MRPISAAVSKAFLPLVDRAGHGRCVLHEILRAAALGGIEQAAVIVAPGQQAAIQQYRQAAAEAGDPDGVKEVECIEQPEPGGLGHAILQAEDFVASEPFMVLLGDHLQIPDPGATSAAAQVADVWNSCSAASVVGMQVVGTDELCRVGVGTGTAIVPGSIYRCSRIIEKPDLSTARQELATDLGDDAFLAHAGVYAFDAEIFDCLRAQPGGSGELGLTEAQQLLMTRHPDDCYLVKLDVRVCDVGHPDGYAEAFRAIRDNG